MAWDPTQYLTFKEHRLRPALDLLTRISLESPESIVDLGCGTGNITKIIHECWPQAMLTGIDSSEEMLATARKDVPAAIKWEKQDIGHWQPETKPDLIYSNATLHWLPDHPGLFPRLLNMLKPGGVLAIQMPNNFAALSHTLIQEAALAGPWRNRLKPLFRATPVLTARDYYRILAPQTNYIDIWETEYLQILEGDNPVAEWTKGTWLKPLLDALDEPEKSRFEIEYRQRILQAYPPEANGTTLLPFKRIFIIAKAET